MKSPYGDAIETLSIESSTLKQLLCIIYSHQEIDEAQLFNDFLLRSSKENIFIAGAITGKLNWINKLESEKTLAMIKARDYYAFRLAAANGHLAILNRLCELAPDDIIAMVQAVNYGTFRLAANGHLAILNRLCELAPNDIIAMVQARDYRAFCLAARNGHHDVVNYLLTFPTCLAYAEKHEREYGDDYVHPFIEARLSTLRSLHDDFEQNDPNGVFDLELIEDCQLGFYMLRNLIRRNDESLLDDMRFLLSIPGIKSLVHTGVSPHEENELLRLALTIGNEEACQLLLTIPAVRELAESNNFYAAEARGQIDLRALAQDSESSMRALSSDEKKRLEKVNRHYRELIDAAGRNNIFDDFKQELESRYERNPATIELDGEQVNLPYTWQDFTQMVLSDEKRQEALTAYYRHKDHTAYRYLSKPNHWMADNASYVYISDDRQQRWSTFEEYKDLIVLLWVAAQDEQMIPTDGHTFESRISHFIDELAHIGRAHNYDKQIVRQISEDITVIGEYDDLEGDRPACYSGVKRRLFQSLIGHPFMAIFNQEVLEQELREMLHDYFKARISGDNISFLEEAVDAITEGYDLTNEQIIALDALDITADTQNDFLCAMKQKYREEIALQPGVKFWLDNLFELKGHITHHVFKFYNLVGFGKLLKKCREAPNASINNDGGESSFGGHASFFIPLESNREDPDPQSIILEGSPQ